MPPTFDPNSSQPNYAIHDEDSIMRDEAPPSSPLTGDDSGWHKDSDSLRDEAPGSSPPAGDNDEFETPPNQKIPLEDIEEMMSQYDDQNLNPDAEGKSNPRYHLSLTDIH